MKLTFIFLLLPLFSFAQGDNETYILQKINGEYKILDSTIVDNAFTKAHLYINAKDYFGSAKIVNIDSLIYDDKEITLFGQCSFELKKWNQTIVNWYKNQFKIEYKTEMILKDGQYQYRFFNIIVYQLSSQSSMYGPLMEVQWKMDDIDLMTKKGIQKKFYKKVVKDIDDIFKNAILELKTIMKK